MNLLIVMVLLALTAWVSFEIGRRYELGLKEARLQSLEEERERRGRRGTVKMKSMKIRR